MNSGEDTEGLPQWVSPFGNLRVNGHLRLTEAYRSLSRPSSPADAKASPVCPCLLPITPSVFQEVPDNGLRPCPPPDSNTRSRINPLREETSLRGQIALTVFQKIARTSSSMVMSSFSKRHHLSTISVLVKMLVSHKEYGLTEKELLPRDGEGTSYLSRIG
jgi:hypothetical protein